MLLIKQFKPLRRRGKRCATGRRLGRDARHVARHNDPGAAAATRHWTRPTDSFSQNSAVGKSTRLGADARARIESVNRNA